MIFFSSSSDVCFFPGLFEHVYICSLADLICSLADLIYISLCSVVLWSPAGGKHARMVIFISHDALGSPSELHP